MSLYSHKQNGTGAVQPWSQAVTLAEAGKGCDGLFGLYDSLGDKTLVGANTIATLQDGPEKVVRYGALTLGDGVTVTSLTAANRCKGLTILCDSLTVKANATLHMTGKGARVLTSDDPFFPFVDFRIPFKIVMDSCRMSLAQAFAVIREQGLAPWDGGTFQHLVAAMYGFSLLASPAGSPALMLASGCGAGAIGFYAGTSLTPGGAGSAGVNGGMGGGGNGGVNGTVGSSYALQAGFGCPYSGGSGQGGLCNVSSNATNLPLQSKYSGKGGKGGGGLWSMTTGHIEDAANPFSNQYPCGGGAGNPGGPGQGGPSTPGGDGTGGKLTIICRGAIIVQSGGKIEANGMPGGTGPTFASGGGSGGGHIAIISPVAASNSGTIQAAGGAGGAGAPVGGAGGAGSVVTKTFAQMGW